MRKCNWLLSGSVCTHLRLCYYCCYRSRNRNSNIKLVGALFYWDYSTVCLAFYTLRAAPNSVKFLVCAHILDPDGCVYSELYLVNYVQVVSVSRIKWVSLTKRLVHIVPEKPQCSNGLCSRGVPCRGSINPSSHSV